MTIISNIHDSGSPVVFSNVTLPDLEDPVSMDLSPLLRKPYIPPDPTAMLGALVYSAKDQGTNAPDLQVQPGRLGVVALTMEGHGGIVIPCRNPEDHNHEELCIQWVDAALIRSAGELQEGLHGSIVFKTDNGHRPIKFLAVTSKGLSFFRLPGKSELELYGWAFPPEPVDLSDGRRIFRDRVIDTTDRMREMEYAFSSALRKQAPISEEWKIMERMDTFGSGRFRGDRRERRGAVQGLFLQEAWRFQDLNGLWVDVPAAQYSPSGNRDSEIIAQRGG